MNAEYIGNNGFLQRDSVEHEEYAEAHSVEQMETREQDNARDLMEEILDRDNLHKAYKRVKTNKGAPGIDGMTVEEALPWLKEHQKELLDSIRGGCTARGRADAQGLFGQLPVSTEGGDTRHQPGSEQPETASTLQDWPRGLQHGVSAHGAARPLVGRDDAAVYAHQDLSLPTIGGSRRADGLCGSSFAGFGDSTPRQKASRLRPRNSAKGSSAGWSDR